MRAGSNFNITRPVQGFQTAPESPLSRPAKRARTESESSEAPPAKRAKTEGGQQASSSPVNASLYTEKSKRLALLKHIQEEQESHPTKLEPTLSSTLEKLETALSSNLTELESSLSSSLEELESAPPMEIQEEPESHLIAEGARTSRDISQGLEMTNIGETPTLPILEQAQELERNLDRNSQNSRAANRDRRAFLNLIKVDPYYAQIITKGFSHACDAAASSLSYSAAALSNSSLYKRSITSGATWTAAAAFNSISRAISNQDRSVVGLFSDAANFGAGIASMAAAGLSHASNPDQKSINYAATFSNGLWMAAGTLASVSTIQRGQKLASQYGKSTLEYAATGLGFAGDWANVAAGTVGIISTATSNGSNPTLNKLSAGFWMAGTALGVISTALSTRKNYLRRKENEPLSQ